MCPEGVELQAVSLVNASDPKFDRRIVPRIVPRYGLGKASSRASWNVGPYPDSLTSGKLALQEAQCNRLTNGKLDAFGSDDENREST
jgi:hypothetical protein